jgi:myo-inositol 2-dehydrogenase/D-chiro-inositol 1-dehydrogenase
MTGEHAEGSRSTRREFLKTTAMAGTALAANVSLLSNVHAAGSDTIKVGVIGCGGRGSGAAVNVLHSAPNVQIVAIGDAFKFRTHDLRKDLLNSAEKDETIKKLGNKVDLPEERCFAGIDAYEKVINSDVNYIILAAPPGFRPTHLQAAVAAGKNIFTEKPAGVDGPGIRKALAAYEDARKKNLYIVAGTQRRHEAGYLETLKQVHGGEIGDITAMRCYWNGQGIWFRNRSELAQNGIPDSDLAYQLHNWYHFVWTCGDHIVEQHVHNLDVCNWAIGKHPVKAVGMGSRIARPAGAPREVGNIFDNFAIDFEYDNGVHMLSMCRQIRGCESNVSEALVGTKGTCRPDQYSVNGKRLATKGRGKTADPYVQEHTDLIECIREGKPINELKSVAESTLTAILGRWAAYTGKVVTWDQVLNSKEDTMPERLSWEMSLQVPPVAIPGTTRLA